MPSPIVLVTPPVSRAPSLRLSKRALSLFFRVGCERQFVLYLYNDLAREWSGMPPRQVGRAGLGLVGRAGYEHQDERVREIRAIFGNNRVHINPATNGSGRPNPLPLAEVLGSLNPYDFVVEAEFEGDTSIFRQSVGLQDIQDVYGNSLSISSLQPDLIQVLPSLAQHVIDDSTVSPRFREEVLPDGSTVLMDAVTDTRKRLRVADIKMTSEPGAHYFAEVVFYSMALAAWLREHGLADEYAVVAAPAVLPGSTNDSHLVTQARAWAAAGRVPTAPELSAAFESDLEIAAVEAYAPRIRELLATRLPALLTHPWEELPYHVSFRCKGCEFLGDPHIRGKGGVPTQDPRHCWPDADRTHHLSRVVGLTRGASEVLRAHDVPDVPVLALLAPGGSSSETQQMALQKHHGLKARRTIYPYRAHALEQALAGVIPDSGGDALMPQWPSLRLYLFIDYDPATARTVAMGCRAKWHEPRPFGQQGEVRRWGGNAGGQEVWLADDRTGRAEKREFLAFLRHLQGILQWVASQDEQDTLAGRRDKKTTKSTYQIYLWDEAQYRHFVRLASRYLADIVADPGIRHLAWLFPPPELLPNPDDGSRRSPFTLVHDVVQNTVALPTPYHYTLIEVARTFNSTNLGAPSLHPLYTESMSNLVPAERIHEYWDLNRESRYRREHGEQIEATNRKKIYALGLVVASLERHLRGQLSRLSAPNLPKRQPRSTGLSPEGYLWAEFTQLNAAVESLEVHRVRAMPPHEREARFRSACLVRRLRGTERLTALAALSNSVPNGIAPGPNLLVYELNADSREFNARPGDFSYALSPRGAAGFLDQHPYLFTQGTSIKAWGDSIEQAHLTEVTVEAIDRTNGTIALRLGGRSAIRALARSARDRTTGARLDFNEDIVLDPVHQDFLTSKVRLTLAGIGNPAIALHDDRTLEALGLPRNTQPGTAPVRPAAEVLWDAQQLATEPSGRDVVALRAQLEPALAGHGRILMPDQWGAWETGLRQLLTLIWGPPGTGKSFTLRALVLGAVLDAVAHEKPLRLLISANTYPAVDNLLLRLQDDLRTLIPAQGERPYRLVRVQSSYRAVEHDFVTTYPDVENIELNRSKPSAAALALRNSLEQPGPREIVIVGAPAQQMYNLATAGGGKPTAQHTQREWFDLMVVDEASQLDVASATLVFSTRARGGGCVLAGDDLQLPPIHQAVPPEGLEAVVGSVYNYIRRRQNVDPVPLNASFRSNSTLIDFTRSAGYDAHLYAHSPALRIRHDVPSTRPADWPDQLPWSDDFHRLLNPEHPAVCVVYDDQMSAQSNPFEADAVASLVWLLRRHLHRGLANELNAHNQVVPVPEPTAPYAPAEFWRRGIGIVVPHRAQMSLIAGRLQALFPGDPATQVRAAVDTVERFQGQERDVILASFGLGDPDVIAAEEEFLYDLRRFNVMASRARAKLVVFVTRSLVEHLSNDSDILNESLLIKRYAEQFCQPAGVVRIGDVEGELRQR
ncbi:MAG TPA: AAA domain-containing protein [Longimicrobium sp.]|jgi:hypothetical protein|uniref:DEAD/DEAH box helicase n=1 Tax=Longimicrobium sp. TaxID=2029185 RepID=UPI002ED85274